MKHRVKYILQKLLGFSNYLFLFSLITIKRLKKNPSEQEFLHFIDITPNEGIILDIGANIGITTIPLAQSKNKAIIYSFEPVPENIQALKRVVNFFKVTNVKTFETALGDSCGKLKMITPVIKNVKMQGLSHIYLHHAEEAFVNGNQITVAVEKLDEIEELVSAIKISAIKIDVENFEYFVLKGARNLLMKHKPLIYCELWKNEKRNMTIDYLKELGYEIKIFDAGQLVKPGDEDRINFFFIPAN